MFLGFAAYLGAFQYDRAMYFSSSTRLLLLQQRVKITAAVGPKNGIGAPTLSTTTHTLSTPTPTAAVPAAPTQPGHPVTFLIGGNLRAKSLFNAAGAVLAVLSIVHSGVGERVFTSPLAMFLGRVSFPVLLGPFSGAVLSWRWSLFVASANDRWLFCRFSFPVARHRVCRLHLHNVCARVYRFLRGRQKSHCRFPSFRCKNCPMTMKGVLGRYLGDLALFLSSYF